MFESTLLRRRLALPLGSATTVSFVAAALWPAGGLFLNLATTFLSILLTVGYVDLVLRDHERRRWSGAQRRIDQRLEGVANVAWSQFRVAFGYSTDIVDRRAIRSKDLTVRRIGFIRAAEKVAREVEANVRRLAVADWVKLERQLQLTWQSADRMLAALGDRLDPETTTDLLDIQDAIGGILSLRSTFPDVLGVPDELLPAIRGEPAMGERRALEDLVSQDIEKTIRAALRILHRLSGEARQTDHLQALPDTEFI